MSADGLSIIDECIYRVFFYKRQSIK